MLLYGFRRFIFDARWCDSVALRFWKFSKANADISLLLKPKPKRDHFKDKVVWITGASSGSSFLSFLIVTKTIN